MTIAKTKGGNKSLSTYRDNLPTADTSKQALAKLAEMCERNKDKLLAALPKGVDGELVIKLALIELRKKPELLACSPSSLFYAISEAVANGLEIGGIRSHSYIVPYGTTATLIVSYKGMIELVRRTGHLESVSLEVVRQGDHFIFELGDNPRLSHTPSMDDDRESKPVTHVYAVFRLKGGTIVRRVWTRARIDAHKERYSQAFKNAEKHIKAQAAKGEAPWESKLSAWHTAWDSQACKTVVRDTVQRGLLPLARDVAALVTRGDVADTGVSTAIIDSSMDAALGFDGLASETVSVLEEVEQPTAPTVVLPDGEVVTVTEAARRLGDQDQLWDELSVSLEEAENLGMITGIEEAYLDKFQNADDQAEARAMIAARAARIRELKSERANS